MGRSSRVKGAVGEREVRDLLREAGFAARRDGRLDEDLVHDIDGWHLEVKRRETYRIDEWLEQTERDAGGRKPLLIFRKSRQPWRAVIRLEDLLPLLRDTNHQRMDIGLHQEPGAPPV